MTKDGTRRYTAAKALVVGGTRSDVVFMRFYNAQRHGRSLKVIFGLMDGPGRAERLRKARALQRKLARLADRVDTGTSFGDTYYFV